MKNLSLILACVSAVALSGCGAVGRLKAVGKVPPMSAVDDSDAMPIEQSLGRPDLTRREGLVKAPVEQGASLFRAGAGAFLADQRAARSGDILTVKINVADRANLGNTTSRTRGGSEDAGVTALLGLEKYIPGGNPSQAVAAKTKSDYTGSGTITRSETINMTMSAIVTNVLPNGNLVIKGRQEMRVNYELRELIVTGIVRPQDIARDNSVRHTQIAEARISYGGRGQLTGAQQARWGQQIYDALFPF